MARKTEAHARFASRLVATIIVCGALFSQSTTTCNAKTSTTTSTLEPTTESTSAMPTTTTSTFAPSTESTSAMPTTTTSTFAPSTDSTATLRTTTGDIPPPTSSKAQTSTMSTAAVTPAPTTTQPPVIVLVVMEVRLVGPVDFTNFTSSSNSTTYSRAAPALRDDLSMLLGVPTSYVTILSMKSGSLIVVYCVSLPYAAVSSLPLYDVEALQQQVVSRATAVNVTTLGDFGKLFEETMGLSMSGLTSSSAVLDEPSIRETIRNITSGMEVSPPSEERSISPVVAGVVGAAGAALILLLIVVAVVRRVSREETPSADWAKRVTHVGPSSEGAIEHVSMSPVSVSSIA